MAADDTVPPTERDLGELRQLMAEVRGLARLSDDGAFRCPWCATATDDGAACRAHRELERRYQQHRWGNGG